MAKHPDYNFAGPEYYRARRKRIWRRSHRRSPRSHTDIRHFKHYRINPAILETKEAQICGDWGVKMRRKFGSDLWERVEELKPYKKVHHSRHSTGWKNQKRAINGKLIKSERNILITCPKNKNSLLRI